MDKAVIVTDVSTAAQSIDTIVEQGEGTSRSPVEKVGDDYAHYYRFAEIYHGKQLIKNPNATPTTPPDEQYIYGGLPVPFRQDGVFPLPTNPKAANYLQGSAARYACDTFNYTYTSLLRSLDDVFNGKADQLDTAIGLMMSLKVQAKDMMAGMPNPAVHVGPSFEYQSVIDQRMTTRAAEPVPSSSDKTVKFATLQGDIRPAGVAPGAEAPKAITATAGHPEAAGKAKAAVTKRAVVAGINNYPPPNTLDSCVADARAFEALLRLTFGFSEVHIILDDQVTVSEFERQLDWLIEGATAESQLVLYYSGHGYAHETQPGMIEEFLVLFDNFLIDNRLVQKVQSLPAGVLTVVLDSCFSGGMEKRVFEVTDAATGERAKIKTLRPPAQLQATEEPTEKNALALKPFGGSAFLLPNKGVIVGRKDIVLTNGSDPSEAGQQQLDALLVSACRETETASASTARTSGLSAFTYCLRKAIGDLGSGASSRQLVERAATELNGLGFSQIPQIKPPPGLKARVDQPFLNAAAAPAMDDRALE
jgi:hypothetical protein